MDRTTSNNIPGEADKKEAERPGMMKRISSSVSFKIKRRDSMAGSSTGSNTPSLTRTNTVSSPGSPEMRPMTLPRSTRPGLAAVDRQLSQLRINQKADDNVGDGGTRVCLDNEASPEKNRKLLAMAMQARDKGQNEMCRGLCREIMKDPDAPLRTQIYARNIMSTMSSDEYTLNYLKQSKKLCKDHIKQDPALASVLGSVEMLLQRFNPVLDGERKREPEVPMTPMTEKIFNWSRTE